jgi:hypothetical protein
MSENTQKVEKVEKSVDKNEKADKYSKQYLVEYFITDDEIINEYKELFRPFKERLRYTIYFNTLLSIALFFYFKKATYYSEILYPNRRRGLHNLILISSLHAFAFTGLLFGGNCLVLGINPITFSRKYKELDRKMIAKDPYYQVTQLNEALDMINTIRDKNKKQ